MPLVTRIRNTVPVTRQYQLRLERVIRRVDCNARIKREQRGDHQGLAEGLRSNLHMKTPFFNKSGSSHEKQTLPSFGSEDSGVGRNITRLGPKRCSRCVWVSSCVANLRAGGYGPSLNR